MKKIVLKKLYNGYASIRDYIVDEHVSKNEPLVIEYNGKTMTVSVSGLRVGKQLHTKKIYSKFNASQVYTLVDFKFFPDSEVSKQKELFQ